MAKLGIDEVGRGPWAGPLVIGAVILPDRAGNDWINELTDSKKLTAKKRETLNEIILEKALATGLGWVTSKELDEVGLSNALKLAARRAVEEVQKKKVPFNEIVIDGTINFLSGTRLEKFVTIMPKADFLVKEVSAASIIAKVARDHYMEDLGKKYPAYGFEKHVGYGTAAHKKALEEEGPCEEHRFSFRPVAEIAEKLSAAKPVAKTATKPAAPKKNTTKIGTKAEQIVIDFLLQKGHKILEHDFKTSKYEIDVVSHDFDSLYFTEVKYRKNADHGSPLAMIDFKKRKQVIFAAECYQKLHPEYSKLNPKIAVAAVTGSDYHLDDWFTLNEL